MRPRPDRPAAQHPVDARGRRPTGRPPVRPHSTRARAAAASAQAFSTATVVTPESGGVDAGDAPRHRGRGAHERRVGALGEHEVRGPSCPPAAGRGSGGTSPAASPTGPGRRSRPSGVRRPRSDHAQARPRRPGTRRSRPMRAGHPRPARASGPTGRGPGRRTRTAAAPPAAAATASADEPGEQGPPNERDAVAASGGEDGAAQRCQGHGDPARPDGRHHRHEAGGGQGDAGPRRWPDAVLTAAEPAAGPGPATCAPRAQAHDAGAVRGPPYVATTRVPRQVPGAATPSRRVSDHVGARRRVGDGHPAAEALDHRDHVGQVVRC